MGCINIRDTFKILKNGKIAMLIASTFALNLYSAPSGGTVTSGSATINQSGTTTNINQSSNKAVINWQGFSIGKNETVNFKQPNTNSVTLNRVLGSEKSVINGTLNANGQVFLLNPNGVLISQTGSINTSGFLATTKSITDSNFMSGNYNFTSNGSSASVINLGTINISNSGYAALVANSVSNEGTINAIKGKVELVSADEVSINLNGNSLVNLTVKKSVLDALVENKGAIYADGGEVYLTTNAANDLINSNINQSGTIRARTLDEITGKVVIFANGGTANISGTIDASAPSSGNGGFIETSGKNVNIADGTLITTKAANGSSGTWLIDPTDFNINSGNGAQTTSSIGANTLQSNLSNSNVTITTAATGAESGDINVNAGVSWSNNTLTLNAHGNINVNAVLDAGNSGRIDFKYGNNGADATKGLYCAIDSNGNFTGKINTTNTSDGAVKINGTNYTVITSLGTATDLWSAGNNTLQGLANYGMLSGNYVLGANIDATATKDWNSVAGTNIFYAHNEGFMPIGANVFVNSMPVGFSGKFNGFGHTIDKLTMNRFGQSYIGLFAQTNNSALISNVGITNSTITALAQIGTQFSNVGVLSGKSNGMILNSYTTGSLYTMNDIQNIGGLVGSSSNTVSNSYSSVSVVSYLHSNNGNVGGLIGLSSGNVINSYATGNVTSDNGVHYIGGLIGSSSGYVSNSYATGNVNSSNNLLVSSVSSYLGGLIGSSSGDVSNSYATGTVFSSNIHGASFYLGGLIGNSSGNVSNSYATGRVQSSNGYFASGSYVGGLIGSSSGNVSNSYSIGSVFVQKNATNGLFIGSQASTGTITNSFVLEPSITYNLDNVGSNVAQTGITVKTQTQMQNINTYANAGWNISIDTNLGSSSYPILRNGQWYIGGTLTPVSYTLSTISSGYTYNGLAQVPTNWTAESIFGSAYSSWTLGTDYTFAYTVDNIVNQVNGFTNAREYKDISVVVLNKNYQLASTGNTNGNFTIAKKQLTGTADGTITMVYSGYDDVSLQTSNYTLSGFVSGQGATFKNGTIGYYNSVNVSEANTVTKTNFAADNFTALKDSNTNLDNYIIPTSASWTARITPAPLTVTTNNFVSSSGIAPNINSQEGCKRSNSCVSSVNLSGNNLGLTFASDTIASNYKATLVIPTSGSDLNVNIPLTWNGFNLKLHTDRSIYINSVLTAMGSSDKVTLSYGNSNDHSYNFGLSSSGFAGKINLQDGQNFSTIRSNNTATITDYTVVGSLSSLIGIPSTGNYAIGSDIGSNHQFSSINSFSGKLDGLGHSVNDISSSNGLFNTLSGTVSNLALTNANITGATANVGGFASILAASGILSNVYTAGSINATNGTNVGGLVGQNLGTIINSCSIASVTGSNTNVGGLVGTNAQGGNISYSYYAGNVVCNAGASYVGGIAGSNSGNISNVYLSGSVTGSSTSHNGGIAGYNLGTITNSLVNGAVSGGGQYAVTSPGTTTYVACGVGETAGCNYDRSYDFSIPGWVYSAAAGGPGTGEYKQVTSPGTSTTYNYSGGLVGTNYGTVTSSFWNTTSNTNTTGSTAKPVSDYGNNISSASAGKTLSELQTVTTYAGWNITGTSGALPIIMFNGSRSKWVMPIVYTLTNVASSYTYNGDTQNPWTASQIFGDYYSSLVLGTDYNFVYNGAQYSGFKNANAYTPISVVMLKPEYVLASSGNTNGSFTITPANLTVTANDFVSSNSATASVVNQSGCVGSSCVSSINLNGSSLSLGFVNTELASNYNTTLIIPSASNTDLNVNRNLSWSGFNLNLQSDKNININSMLTANGVTDKLTLLYGQSASRLNNPYSYNIGFGSSGSGGKVNLHAGQNFSTIKGNNGASIDYTVITALGTASDATSAPSAMTLQGLATQTRSVNNLFVLGADIDARETSLWNSRAGFTPVGSSENYRFTGTFDGLGHTINGLTINRPSTDYQGLFGYAAESSIRNVGVINANITGASSVGTLVGFGKNLNLVNSMSSGSVSGKGMTGGLVGWNNSGAINYSFSSANIVSTGDRGGGLVGWNSDATIANSYATGSVTGLAGSDGTGGLVGSNQNATISNSYSTGRVSGTGSFVGGLVGWNNSVVTNSFWDTQTSGQSTSAGGTGQTTMQMQSIATFAGWNITQDTSLGFVYPIFKNGAWVIGNTPVTYTLPIASSLTANGRLQVPANWTAANIFGAQYSNWQLGTDYMFMYNGNLVNGFATPGQYNNVSVKILKSGFAYYPINSILPVGNLTVNADTVIISGTQSTTNVLPPSQTQLGNTTTLDPQKFLSNIDIINMPPAIKAAIRAATNDSVLKATSVDTMFDALLSSHGGVVELAMQTLAGGDKMRYDLFKEKIKLAIKKAYPTLVDTSSASAKLSVRG